MNYLGIDPGLNGALCILSDKGIDMLSAFETKPVVIAGNKRETFDIKSCLNLLSRIAKKYSPLYCKLERSFILPMQSAQSGLTIGHILGTIETSLVANKIKYDLIRPSLWTKEIHSKTLTENGHLDIDTLSSKEKSLLCYEYLFPGHVLPLCNKQIRLGYIDAILIAEYARRTYENIQV